MNQTFFIPNTDTQNTFNLLTSPCYTKLSQNPKGLAQKLAPKKGLRYTRANPDPNPPAVFQNPNTIPKLVRNQQKQDKLADLSPQPDHPNPIPTPIKVLFRSTPNSPSSPSTSQSSPPIPSSPTHVLLSNTVKFSVPVTLWYLLFLLSQLPLSTPKI